jgi:transposase
MSGFNPTLDPRPVVVRRLDVLTGAGGRRGWSPDDKAQIVEETCTVKAKVCFSIAASVKSRPDS